MEDSSCAGWTTPPDATPYGIMDVPEGRRLESPPQRRGQLGELRPLPRATPDAIKYAERIWPQGRVEDFEREGRKFTDRATGTEYRLVHGNPLLGIDPKEQDDLFLVADDTLWFLIRADRSLAHSVSLGSVGGLTR